MTLKLVKETATTITYKTTDARDSEVWLLCQDKSVKSCIKVKNGWRLIFKK